MTPTQYADSKIKEVAAHDISRIAELTLHSIIEQAYTAGQSADKWVSAKDRLPDEYTDVLTCIQGSDNPTEQGYIGLGVWRDSIGDEMEEPTHWMYLPTPPAL